MAAFVIFGAALLAIFFFIAGTFFKALASAFNALLSTVGVILRFAVLATLTVVALCLISIMAAAIASGSLGQIIWTIFLLALVIGLLGTLFVGLGTSVLEFVIMIITHIVTAALFVLEGAASICEKGYAKFLTVVISKAEMC